MLSVVVRLLLCVSAAVFGASVFVCAEYTESLTLRPLLHSNKVLAHFHFATKEPNVVTRSSSGSVFPKVLQQILTKYSAESLHLTFSLGKYSDARYGSAQSSNSSNAFVNAPFGARLQVRLNTNRASIEEGDVTAASGEDIQQRWRGITAELGGIFSASLNQMDETVVTRPFPFDADPSALGAFSMDNTATSPDVLFLHAGLAREEICTENLTPWLKMLPCRSITGLGKLIDPIKYLSGEYLSLSLFAAQSSSSGEWTLHQHLTSVQALSATERKAWSLRDVFLKSLPSDEKELDSCPLANESAIYTELPKEGFTVQQPGGFAHNLINDRPPRATPGASVVHTINLKEKQVSLTEPWLKESDGQQSVLTPSQPRDITNVHRFVTGYGQVHGGIAVRLENNHPVCAMRVTYHDIVPWYLRLYFNTFQAKAFLSPGNAAESAELVRKFQFVPADLRGCPNQLHLELVLPANSSLVFSIQLDKAFLRLSEHPPDANRGFDVPSGIATFTPIAENVDYDHQAVCATLGEDMHAFTRTLFTEPLLVPLPTPDFSMPYNVITMTSTVVAFFVGSMLNTLLRKAPRIKQMMTKEPPTK
uniref:GPI transamidase component n=1 Tax=Globisporangium ultimum (strain ATCC 200006 / CBS 805.95 / DAOM BR144) TaxID=431595 RepID=K3WZ64_GLOUD